ncbi:MAG: hypothetical protein MI862_12790 [Desulfobacterales bacterium]|nr:hypothetical protein [Desulfobacterales bacterium]
MKSLSIICFTFILVILFFTLSLAQNNSIQTNQNPYNTEQGTYVPEHARQGNYNFSNQNNSPSKNSGATISEYKPLSCYEKCNYEYQKCMQTVNYNRAKNGAGKFSAMSDAAYYSGCKVSKSTCFENCN